MVLKGQHLKPEQDCFHFHFPKSCSGSKDIRQWSPRLSAWQGIGQAAATPRQQLSASALTFSVWGHRASCLGPLQLVMLIAVLLLAFDSLVGWAETYITRREQRTEQRSR